MRLLFCGLLISGLLVTGANAQQPTFIDQISAHILAHPMSYPPDLLRQVLGTGVVVKFSLNQDGRLLSRRVERASGSPKADQYVLDWLSSLQPFPAPPPEMKEPANFTLPVNFQPPLARRVAPPITFDQSPSYLEGERKLKQIIGNMCKGC